MPLLSQLPESLTLIVNASRLAVYASGTLICSTPTTPVYFLLTPETSADQTGVPQVAMIPWVVCKRICQDIISRHFEEETVTRRWDDMAVSVIALQLDRRYRAPFVIKISNGVTDNGTAGDVFTGSDTITLPHNTAIELALSIYDYLFAAEIVCWRRFNDQQTVSRADLEIQAGLIREDTKPQQKYDIYWLNGEEMICTSDIPESGTYSGAFVDAISHLKIMALLGQTLPDATRSRLVEVLAEKWGDV